MRQTHLELDEEYIPDPEATADLLLPELRSATRRQRPPEDLGLFRLLEAPSLHDRGRARTRGRRLRRDWQDHSPDPFWPDAA